MNTSANSVILPPASIFAVCRFLDIADADIAQFRADMDAGRRPDFENMLSIANQADAWMGADIVADRASLRTQLNTTRRTASNMLCMGF